MRRMHQLLVATGLSICLALATFVLRALVVQTGTNTATDTHSHTRDTGPPQAILERIALNLRQSTSHHLSHRLAKNEDALNQPDSPHILHVPWSVCADPEFDNGSPYVITGIESRVADFKRRIFLRKMHRFQSGNFSASVFVVNAKDNTAIHQIVEEEHKKYGDLIVADVEDSYSALPNMTFMLFHWFAKACTEPKWMIKTDADVVINWTMLRHQLLEIERVGVEDEKRLRRFPDKDPVWLGQVIKGQPLVTDPVHRNYESAQDVHITGDVYPPYMSGPLYLMNKDAASIMAKTRISLNYHFRNEDAMVGILLQHTEVAPSKLKGFIALPLPDYIKEWCSGEEFESCDCHQWAAIQLPGPIQRQLLGWKEAAACKFDSDWEPANWNLR
eukprot:Gregarina_sp_Poly_1__1182@NODE_128_length_13277_cov_115_450643_g114_i0_p6_GENE_NODE_128_length_13277_cov_115_450643_g114_i0NODE_128_length_13277_cov_115_450643_g114_i0_p6_ORF_typecomplete_len388_score40_26Galactosyl_T/PF01762_21/3_4e35Fringe/PF02434_16/1_9e07_NODE_128_length_13277_cov_115_450643_g114_i050846247